MQQKANSPTLDDARWVDLQPKGNYLKAKKSSRSSISNSKTLPTPSTPFHNKDTPTKLSINKQSLQLASSSNCTPSRQGKLHRTAQQNHHTPRSMRRFKGNSKGNPKGNSKDNPKWFIEILRIYKKTDLPPSILASYGYFISQA